MINLGMLPSISKLLALLARIKELEEENKKLKEQQDVLCVNCQFKSDCWKTVLCGSDGKSVGILKRCHLGLNTIDKR
jgi:hypothetical protein